MNDTPDRSGTFPAAPPSFSAHPGIDHPPEDELPLRNRLESVEGIVDRVMAKINRGRGAPAALLSARWSEVVGDDFAAKTRPASCDAGRLVVLVADGATASRMRFTTSQILHNAAEIAGEGKVSSISFRVSPGLGR